MLNERIHEWMNVACALGKENSRKKTGMLTTGCFKTDKQTNEKV